MYFDYINENEYRQLSREEEYELFEKYKTNNDLEARDKLVFCHYKMSYEFIKRYNGNLYSLTKEDLYQYGYLIIVDTMNSFDYKQGNRFSTYLYQAFQTKLRRIVIDNDKLVRIPFVLGCKFEKIHSIVNKLKLDENKITYKEVKKIDKTITLKEFEDYKKYFKKPLSLDEKLSTVSKKSSIKNSEKTIIDSLKSQGGVLEEVLKVEFKKTISDSINNLQDDKREIIKCLYFDNMTKLKCKEKLNIGLNTVTRKRDKALMELSHNKNINDYKEIAYG